MKHSVEQKQAAFARLLKIMDELREQCPWDQKQTLESLRPLSIEEVYELSEAILKKDWEELKGEIGDLMLHMVFYAKIASEQNRFDIADVLEAICEKLIRRHPHIYGEVKVSGEEEVKQNWEQIKLKEGRKSALEGVPNSLPALLKAQRIQEKARGVGFDWEEENQVWEKVKEEMQEFEAHFRPGQEFALEAASEEFGDLLFSLVNYARFLNIDPETALERTNQKFSRRFRYLEEAAQQAGKKLKDMSLAEMDKYWEEAKKFDLPSTNK